MVVVTALSAEPILHVDHGPIASRNGLGNFGGRTGRVILTVINIIIIGVVVPGIGQIFRGARGGRRSRSGVGGGRRTRRGCGRGGSSGLLHGHTGGLGEDPTILASAMVFKGK